MADFRSRRQVLRSGVALGSIAVAGCLDGSFGDGGNDTNATNGTGTNASSPNNSGSDEPDWETVERWPQYQFDEKNTGYAHAEAGIDSIEEQWTVEFEEKLYQSPVVVDDVAYLRDTVGNTFAVADGDIIWTTDIGGQGPGMPVVNDGVVAFTAEDCMVGLDRADGTEVWEYSPEGSPLNPILVDGTVVFPNDSNEMYALDVETGEEQWTKSTDYGHFAGYPAVYDSESFIAQADGRPDAADPIMAFDLGDGGHRPAIQTELLIETGLTIRDDTAFFGADDGVHAFSMDGDHLWHYPTNHPIKTGLATTEESVFAISGWSLGDGNFHAISIEDGEQQWSRSSNTVKHAPAVVGDIAFFPIADTTLAAHDASTGEELWTTETKRGIYPVAFANGRYFISTIMGGLYCFGPN